MEFHASSTPLTKYNALYNFSESEVNELRDNIENTVNCFMDQSYEGFLAFCSIITRGKELSSPSKRRRRTAFYELFESLCPREESINSTNKHANPDEICISYLGMAFGLSQLSSRWQKFPFDELLTLALLMDPQRIGSISWQHFYNFTSNILDSLKQNLNPVIAFQALYDDIVATYVALTSPLAVPLHDQLQRNLQSLCEQARKTKLTPLRKLIELKSAKEYITEEDMVKLLVYLGGTVEGLCPDTTDLHVLHTSFTPKAKPKLPTRAMMGPAHPVTVASSSSTHPRYTSHIFEKTKQLDSTAANDKSSKFWVPSNSFAPQKPLTLGDPNIELANNLQIALANSIQLLERNARKIASQLDHQASNMSSAQERLSELHTGDPDLQLHSSSSVSSSPSPALENSPAQGSSTDKPLEPCLDWMKEHKQGDSVESSQKLIEALLSMSSSAAASACAPAASDVLVDASPMPQEFKYSTLASLSSVLGSDDANLTLRSAALTLNDTSVDLSSPKPSTHSSQHVHAKSSEQQLQQQEQGQLRNIMAGQESSCSPHALSMQTDQSLSPLLPTVMVETAQLATHLAPTQPAVKGGRIMRIGQPKVLKIVSILPTSSENIGAENYESVSEPAVGIGSEKRCHFATGSHHTRRRHSMGSPRTTQVNMNIFKSPGARQYHGNVNTYAKDSCGWVPTKLTGRYNERFQSTDDLRMARKLNSVLYS